MSRPRLTLWRRIIGAVLARLDAIGRSAQTGPPSGYLGAPWTYPRGGPPPEAEPEPRPSND